MILDFDSKEQIAGTFIIGIFILLLSMVVLIGRGKDWFKKNIIYYTSFSESYNITENAPVKLFNAEIGKVTKVTLVGDQVEFTLAIFEDYAHRIKTDSLASVDGISYIGKKYISLKPGTQDAEILRSGGDIPTSESKSLSEVLSEFEIEKTAKMVISSIQDLSDLAQMLKNPEGPLFTALNSANKTLFEIENTIGVIMENAVVATSKVPGTIDQANTDLEKINEISERVLENIAIIQTILSNLEKGSQDVPPIARSAKDKLQKAGEFFGHASEIAKSLKKNVLLRSNIPLAPKGDSVDAGLR